MGKIVSIQDMDLRLLRVFKAVAECGGFGAAENELNINRSTISTHMADLETRLGLSLCNRSRGRSAFSLTEHGAEVYKAVCQLFDDIHGFRNRLSAIKSELSGKLRIALPDDWLQLTQVDLVPAFTRFRAQAPQVELEIIAHAPNEIDFDIMNNHADVAINVVYDQRPGLQYEFLYRHHTSLYCGCQHPLFSAGKISEKKLRKHQVVGASHSVSDIVNRLYRKFEVLATANHMSGRAMMILSGTYLGFLPDYYAETWVTQEKMKRINVKGFDYLQDNCVIYRKDARKNPVLDLFVNEVFGQAPSTKQDN